MSVSTDTVNTSNPTNKVHQRAWLLLSIVAAAWVVSQIIQHHGVMFWRNDLFAGDAAQHIWWMQRFADPQLFPNDLIARYMSLAVFSPPAYQMLFRATSGWIEPQSMSELLAIVLAILSLGLAMMLGKRLGGHAGMFAAIIVVACFNLTTYTEGGFPRSFGLPLLIAGMLAIVSQRWVMTGGVFVLCALFYPPMILNLAPVAGVVWVWGVIRRYRSHEKVDARWIAQMSGFVALGLAAVGIIAALYLKPMPAEIGSWYSVDEARQMPEWQANGRTAFFRPAKIYWYHSSTTGIGLRKNHLAIGLIALGVTLGLFPRAIPIEAWLLLGFAIAMWALSHAMLFKLYLPSRYTSYALPVFAMMWAARLLQRVRITNRSIAFAPAWALLALILIGAMTTRTVSTALSSSPKWDPPAGYFESLEAIRHLPKNALIASHPDDANGIPLLSARSVLVNTEVSVSFNRAYDAQMRASLIASFDMLYATDWRAIDRIADEFGVSYFLLNRDRLENPSPYFEPHATRNAPLIARGLADGFAMLNPPTDRIASVSGRMVLLRVGTGGSN